MALNKSNCQFACKEGSDGKSLVVNSLNLFSLMKLWDSASLQTRMSPMLPFRAWLGSKPPPGVEPSWSWPTMNVPFDVIGAPTVVLDPGPENSSWPSMNSLIRPFVPSLVSTLTDILCVAPSATELVGIPVSVETPLTQTEIVPPVVPKTRNSFVLPDTA